MQKPHCFKSAINFLTAGITLSLLILLNSMASAHTEASYSKGKDYSTADCTDALPETSGQVGAEAASNPRFGVMITGSCSRTDVSNVTWIAIISGAGATSSDFAEHLATLAVNAALIKKPTKRGSIFFLKIFFSYNLFDLQYFDTFAPQKIAPSSFCHAKQIVLRRNPNVNYIKK